MAQGGNSFDPRKGHQAPWTGVLGGLLLLGFVTALAWLRHGGGAGQPLPASPPLLPLSLQSTATRREFFDLTGLLAVAFFFMVAWEFRTRPLERGLLLAVSACGLGTAGVAALRPDALPGFVAACGLTGLEFALILTAALVVAVWALPLAGRPGVLAAHERAPAGWALRTGFWRWAAGAAAMLAVLAVFSRHPFYLSNYYKNWRLTFGYIFWVYLLLGLPYAYLTNLLRGGRYEDRKDAGFILLLVGRGLALALFAGEWSRFGRIMKDRRVRTMLRDLLVKFFFLPLMITFLHVEATNFFRHLPGAVDPDLSWSGRLNHVYWAVFHGLFIMDTGLSSIGYACSSRWLDNKSRSVEPFWAGWAAALACYPPFNGVVSDYLPYNRGFDGTPYLSITGWSWLPPETASQLSEIADMALGGVSILMYVVFVWATMSFGLRFSNLTNRGIITRGPYAFVRHPAYIAKNAAWWCESIRRFSSPWQFVFLLGWNAVYYARAWTEERHLRADPAYRSYCALVDRMFIPRVLPRAARLFRGRSG